ncbi:hypothetical protein LP420_12130 [Massilia sp. B-10]|nr:hypothetical protein LP420_12130 [Massilia sp. B-10]
MPMLLAYGGFGLPLAMVALPIYVYLPQFYAARARACRWRPSAPCC